MSQASLTIINCLIGATILSFVGCESHDTKASPYPDRAFSESEWKKDSTGCLHYRERTYESLAKNEDFFRGKPIAYLVQLLGRPSVFSKGKANRASSTIYYVVDCTEIPTLKTKGFDEKPVYSNADATTLVFDIKKDTCTNVRIAVP